MNTILLCLVLENSLRKNQINRVGSFSRLTVKLLSPVGVLYMNNNLGGEHHVTLDNQHDYSGYSYLNRNLLMHKIYCKIQIFKIID